MTDPIVPVHDPRNLAALWSFLRVLAVAEASALLPLWIAAADYPTLRAMALAAVPAFLLTVINYLRPGETRFGTAQPNAARADDRGAADTRALAVAALVLAVVVAAILLL